MTAVHPNFAKYADPGVRVHRDDASAILEYVGKNSPGGNYPQDIPPYILGRAVRRLVFNYYTDRETGAQDEYIISREFLAGFRSLTLR